MITPVILSGGSGTRLWPLSTPDRPKQSLPLLGRDSLFAQTVARVADRGRYGPPIVVTSHAHEQLCRNELRETPGACLILEPIARNTAVAIVLAAASAIHQGHDPLLLIMPSDHRIGHNEAFHAAVANAAAAAADGRLVTFGVAPTSPETGFGYLQAGDRLPGLADAFSVVRFKEKPTADSARDMIAKGDHYWNGGIFCFKASVFLAECALHAPEILRCGLEAMAQGVRDHQVVRPAAGSLDDCPAISVDYAVMERSSEIAMVPLDAEWSDVGSWDALADLTEESLSGAAVALRSDRCFVKTDGLKVALLNVDDLIVIATGKQVVIVKRGASQGIKELAALASNG